MRIIRNSFTLMEVVVVVIIISIVAAIGIPTYFNAIDNTRSKERDSMLELLADAAKMYHLEKSGWPFCGDTDACNEDLNLNLPDTFIYSIVNTPPVQVCGEDPKKKLDPITKCDDL